MQSNAKKHVVLIPYWIADALQRRQMPLRDCLDYAKLKEITSLQDLVLFVTAQDLLDQSNSWQLSLIWGNTIPVKETEVPGMQTLRQHHEQVLKMSSDDCMKAEVVTRYTNYGDRNSEEKPFITYDLTESVCGVVLYPSLFTKQQSSDDKALSPDKNHLMALVESVLATLYVYQPHHEVAKLPVFEKYLELLAA